MRFRNEEDKVFEVERTKKRLKLVTIRQGDYFKGAPHDLYVFEDLDSGLTYCYQSPYSYNLCKSYTKFGEDLAYLAYEEGNSFIISAYFVEPNNWSGMYRPRVIKQIEV